jgi:predicted ArsR family transcriptional regulator
MNGLQREWEIKLQLMGAITRSQEALAKILESTAEVTGAVGISAATLHEHVRVLTGMQGALLRTVTGTSWKPPVMGRPAKPWLSEGIKHCDYSAGGGSN